MSRLSERLTALRKGKGLSQHELAREIGLTRSAIGMYEIGKREPDLETMERFADYYGVDMNTLTGRGEVPHAKVREVLSEGGMRLLMDADAKISEEHIEEIVEFIKRKQRENGR